MNPGKGKFVKQTGLEEEVEFSNVTNLRESLLGTVENLRANPARRYVITKHGQPQAVLMSYETYSLLKKVMDQVLARTIAASSSDPIGAAVARLRADEPGVPVEESAVGERAVSATVSAALQNIRAQFDHLDAVLGQDLLKQRK